MRERTRPEERVGWGVGGGWRRLSRADPPGSHGAARRDTIIAASDEGTSLHRIVRMRSFETKDCMGVSFPLSSSSMRPAISMSSCVEMFDLQLYSVRYRLIGSMFCSMMTYEHTGVETRRYCIGLQIRRVRAAVCVSSRMQGPTYPVVCVSSRMQGPTYPGRI